MSKHSCLCPSTKFDRCNKSFKSTFDRKRVERIPEWAFVEPSLADRCLCTLFDWLSSLIRRSDAVQHLSEIVTRRQGKGGDYSGPDGHLPEIEE